MSELGCIFCKIGRGEVPAEVLYCNDRVYVIRDINPKAPVHLLVVPYAHIEAISSDPAPDSETLSSVVATAAQFASVHGIGQGGYRLVINQGPDAGQTLPHLHLHLLGGHQLSDLG